MDQQPTFQESRETQIVKGLFLDLRARDPALITWSELVERTGCERSALYNYCRTAANWVCKTHGLVIKADRGIGYRLATDPEIVTIGDDANDKARRVVRKGQSQLACADQAKLTAEERSRLFVAQTVGELVLGATRPRTRNHIEQMVLRKSNLLDQEELLAAIRDGLTKR